MKTGDYLLIGTFVYRIMRMDYRLDSLVLCCVMTNQVHIMSLRNVKYEMSVGRIKCCGKIGILLFS